LAGLSSSAPLPDQVHLIGGGSALPEMLDAVRALAWSQRLHFARYPQVSRLRPTGVPGVVNRTDTGRKMGDVSALALSAWAVQVQGRRDRPDLLISELCQLGE
jgi:hypothetical protein